MFKKLAIGALATGIIFSGGVGVSAEKQSINNQLEAQVVADTKYIDKWEVMYGPNEKPKSTYKYNDGTYKGTLTEYDREETWLGTIVYYHGEVTKYK
ncbi:MULTISPECIES: hypothetical protein [Bacillus cereus group]|uniref:hypothetical protein n=1 Tax=Bacillus cereus group TaxID=86661 RepID=UPI0022E7EEF4|nr:hypothetical protein [Bacillus cereus group sp. Bc253]MDA2157657.1 hypothetical protein [Bacillus cereus group sp. Bc253]